MFELNKPVSFKIATTSGRAVCLWMRKNEATKSLQVQKCGYSNENIEGPGFYQASFLYLHVCIKIINLYVQCFGHSDH